MFLAPLKLKMHKREEAISMKKVVGASVSMRWGRMILGIESDAKASC